MSHLATPRTMSSVLGQYCNAEVEQLPRSDSQLIVIFQFGFTGPQMREEIKNATSFSPNRSFNEQAVNLIFWHLLFGHGINVRTCENISHGVRSAGACLRSDHTRMLDCCMCIALHDQSDCWQKKQWHSFAPARCYRVGNSSLTGTDHLPLGRQTFHLVTLTVTLVYTQILIFWDEDIRSDTFCNVLQDMDTR